MKFYLLRHTEVENPLAVTLRRKQGFHLSKKGCKQAQEVASFLVRQNIPIKRILTSPLERCFETSEIIKAALNSTSQVEAREYLNEWERGEKSEDIASRIESVMKEVQNNDLFISHQDVIRVFINMLSHNPLLNTDLGCSLGSFYQFDLDENKELSNFGLLFAPK